MTTFPLLPTQLKHIIGQVVAAIPVHMPVNDTDPAEWIVMCDRSSREPDLVGDQRRFCTNRLYVRGDTVVAAAGEYDLTYPAALRSLQERAGMTPPERITVWTLMVDSDDRESTVVTVHESEAAAYARLRDEYDPDGDLSHVPDDNLFGEFINLTVEIDSHEVPVTP